MLAVCLLTCDRPELTARTVESFAVHNAGRADLCLLHADGGSQMCENVDLAAAHGFHTLVAPLATERIGQMETLRIFLAEVTRQQIGWVVWLENDWESVVAMPSTAFLDDADIETARLFGRLKFRDGKRAPAGRLRIGTTEPIVWQTDRPGWERGRAHWGAGGTIVRTSVLQRQAHQSRLKDVILAENNLVSLRPVENIMWSIGQDTTEGFKG